MWETSSWWEAPLGGRPFSDEMVEMALRWACVHLSYNGTIYTLYVTYNATLVKMKTFDLKNMRLDHRK